MTASSRLTILIFLDLPPFGYLMWMAGGEFRRISTKRARFRTFYIFSPHRAEHVMERELSLVFWIRTSVWGEVHRTGAWYILEVIAFREKRWVYVYFMCGYFSYLL